MIKIFVAGHNGMVGRAICKKLQNHKDIEIISRSRDELNLLDQNAVEKFFKDIKPDEVILAAAKVGGIYANNTYPADFIYENLQIQNNVIYQANKFDVQKLLFLGSSCIYPKHADQPIKEDCLLTSELEKTNEPYAIAKIAGIKMCESFNRQFSRDYRSIMPTNLYGPGDNYHPTNSHAVAALIRKFHEAKVNNKKQVKIWGTGKVKREFLFVDDMAEAALLIHHLDKKDYDEITEITQTHVNIGYGEDIYINELAETIKLVSGYSGDIIYEKDMPDGTPRKLLNSNKLRSLGWIPRTELNKGLKISYEDFKRNHYKLGCQD